MPAERRHEAEDLEDYEVLDSSDTLDGPPGDDPLDRGVATPEHWSRGVRYGTTDEEQFSGESLDELLGEEEPDFGAEDDDTDEFGDLDENAPEDDVERNLADDGPDPRAGRLITEEADADEAEDIPLEDGESVARDTGIDTGAATAEEAAVHVLPEEETEAGDEQ